MECKITSTKARSARSTAGVTLVEFLIGIPLGILAMGLTVSFAVYTSRSFAGLLNYADLENNSRNAVDKMGQQIRQATSLAGFTTNKLAFTDYDGKSLVFDYNPTNRTLVRTKDSITTVLLSECDSLNFSIFQRCTTNGTFGNYPTTLQASNTKVVQMTWACSRAVAGSKMNTESMQTAKIVIRNQQ